MKWIQAQLPRSSWDLEQLWWSLVEFTILRNTSQVWNRGRLLNFRKAGFQLFREADSGIPWETALRDKGMEQSWQIFRKVFY